MSGSILAALTAANGGLFPADRLTGPSPLHVTVEPDAVTPGEWWTRNPTAWSLRRHVSRSQVWEGSRGGVRAVVHLHLPIETRRTRFASVIGRKGVLVRRPGQSLCGKGAGWYETDAGLDGVDLCPGCREKAYRYGIEIPGSPTCAGR